MTFVCRLGRHTVRAGWTRGKSPFTHGDVTLHSSITARNGVPATGTVCSLNWTTVASLSVLELVANELSHDRCLVGHRRQPRLCFRFAHDRHANPSDNTPIFGLDINTPVAWIKTLFETVGPIAAFPSA